MHVTWMSVNRAPVFKQRLEFTFDDQVNVFVGPNATGKSSLLRMLGMPVHDGNRFGGNWFQYIGEFGLGVSVDWPLASPDPDAPVPLWSALPWVQICATRMGLPISEVGTFGKLPRSGHNSMTLAGIFRHGYDRDVFDGYLAEAALNMLIDEAKQKTRKARGISERRRLRGRTIGEFNLLKAMEISHSCGRQITSEVVTGSGARNLVKRDSDFIDDLFFEYPDVRQGMAVDIVDGDLIAMNDLSSGTQTSLLWTRFLALQMLYHYGLEDGWEKQPAILLIDEIENHLHPTWQRRVIPALLEHFPGLQIFATTHSPFVVAGREAGQVHQLIRDTNGLITAKTNTEPIKGLTADEISRKYLEVQDPTDLATAEAAQELRQLRDEGLRADEREEAERQKRMQQLRRLVDRDLLAGGPMARRREEFANRFREAMARRREEELNQDNG